MNKIMSVIVAIAIMLLMLPVTIVSAAEEATIKASAVEGQPGRNVKVTISMENNPGVTSVLLSVSFDDTVLTLKEVQDGGILGAAFHSDNHQNPYTLSWANDTATSNITVDGTIVTLIFSIVETATMGTKIPVQVTYEYDNYDIIDKDMNPVKFKCIDGYVGIKEEPVAAVYENGAEQAQYSDFGKAAEACGANGYVKLLCDTQVDVTLTKDLYVDLNGFDLSGTLTGGKVYGMDSSTNAYNCENRGVFNCKDASGAKVVPETHFKSAVTGSIKRYMAIREQSGYSFHRFYLGVTHMSVRPAVTSVGFKATFYGDEMVVAALDSENAYGYSLELTGGTSVEVYKGRSGFVSGQPVTLRIDNYDVENQGETVLTGKAVLKLQDGTVIESSGVTMTLRQLLEGLNANSAQMTAQQLAAVKKMIQKYEIIQSWKVENLI